MPEIALIKSPWEDVFLDLVEQTKEKLRITSPFIKLNPVEKMISAKDADVSIEYITSFKLMNFYRKSSDFKALDTISRKPLRGKINCCLQNVDLISPVLGS